MAAKQKKQQPQPITEQPAPRVPFAELPEWLQGTCPQECYEMEHFDCGGDSVEAIFLSREEYIALKVHLATLRGIPLTQHQVDALDNEASYNQRHQDEPAAA